MWRSYNCWPSIKNEISSTSRTTLINLKTSMAYQITNFKRAPYRIRRWMKSSLISRQLLWGIKIARPKSLKSQWFLITLLQTALSIWNWTRQDKDTMTKKHKARSNCHKSVLNDTSKWERSIRMPHQHWFRQDPDLLSLTTTETTSASWICLQEARLDQ